MSTIQKKGINKTAPKFWLSQAEILSINDHLNGQPKLLFQIMVATGLQFSHIRETKWSGFNALLNTLEINGQNKKLPLATAKALLALRKTALAEDDNVFSVCYEYTWGRVSRACYALDIEQGKGVLKLAKWTYARRHFETFKSKKRLATDMGLTTTRWIPKQVFQYQGPTASLFQF